MIRLTCLSLAMAAVAPFGCPPTDTTPPYDDSLRDTIAVTASAAPTTASAGDTVTLQAAGTAPDDGAEIHFFWQQIGGGGTAIQDSDQPAATFAAPSLKNEQTLTFLVTAATAAGATGRAEVKVLVKADPDYSEHDFGDSSGSGSDQSPTADAGQNQSVRPGETVALDGTNSTGIGLQYRWRQVSGAGVTLTDTAPGKVEFVAPAYQPDGDNDLVFELTVTDSQSRSVNDRTRVTVRDPNVSDTEVKVSTTMGDFVIELYPEDAPLTVENFLQYVDDGFYDGTLFHRVIPGFVIQGGGYTSGLNVKDTRDPVAIESDNGLENDRTAVAMARMTDPNSATSQFYVNLVDNDFLNYTSPEDPGYTVFGHVTEGMDIVDLIATVQTESRAGFNDVPVTDVIINSITRLQLNPGSTGADSKTPQPGQ